MSRLLRRAALTLPMAAIVFQIAMGGAVSGQSAEGVLRNVGGNGPLTCERTLAEVGPKSTLGPPTNGIASTVFRTNPGMRGVAADLRSNLYLAYGGFILGKTSILAGVGLTGTQDEGAPGLETAFPSVVGIAADPTGGSLWVLQGTPSPVHGAPPGNVRHIELQGSLPVTTVAQTGTQPTAIAADGNGNAYVTEATGAVYMVNRAGGRTELATSGNAALVGAKGIAVDALARDIFVSSDAGVFRLGGSAPEMVAGPTVVHADRSAPVTQPRALTIGHQIDDTQGVRARYLYIADVSSTTSGRVVRVELSSPRVLTTVAGGGSSFVERSTETPKGAQIDPQYLAADTTGIYIAATDQCALFHLSTPPAYRPPAEFTNPPGSPTHNTLPPDSGRTSDNQSPAPDPAPTGNGNPQIDTGTGGHPAGQGTRTEIVPGSQTNVQPQVQTELRIIDQGNVVTAPEQVAQPTVDVVPTPAPTPQFTPTPAPTPIPSPTPGADVGAVTLADPGTSAAGVSADASGAVPAAPAPAPVPPPPASAPTPAAQQPVSNVGLAHGDSGSPARGATRYAMVRNDDDASMAGLAMAGGGALVAIFLCAMFVAPGASSKPKPRPKGAY